MSADDDGLVGSSGKLVQPWKPEHPLRRLVFRLLAALACVVAVAAIVYFDQDGYSNAACGALDEEGCGLTVLDSFYYATVTLSTTGYGDIAPVSESARAWNLFVVTPLRFTFLLVLVGTAVETLTKRSRYEYAARRWRERVSGHTVIIGFGIKGRTAAEALEQGGIAKNRMVVVADDDGSISEASERQLTSVRGDARNREVLKQAGVGRAERVVIATDQDATSLLITMVVRSMNQKATIVSAARESSNAQFLEESGADHVIVTAEAIGRLLSLSLIASGAGELMEDLLKADEGLEIAQRAITPEELGLSPESLAESGEIVLTVKRDGQTHRFDGKSIKVLNRGDEIVVIRASEGRRSRGARVETEAATLDDSQ